MAVTRGRERLLLIDKSAWVRGPAAAAAGGGELCLCAVTRLEIMFSARSQADYAALRDELSLFRDLAMNAETFAAAEAGQRELAAGGRHRIPLPDLLIAACAQQHAADVLHVDRHFDALSEVFTFNAVRLPVDEVT